jgi:hypothetical protein
MSLSMGYLASPPRIGGLLAHLVETVLGELVGQVGMEVVHGDSFVEEWIGGWVARKRGEPGHGRPGRSRRIDGRGGAGASGDDGAEAAVAAASE